MKQPRVAGKGVILVTGATGSVGRHVVSQLLDAGAAVRALTRDPEVASLPEGVDVHQGDLARPGTLLDALRDVKGVFLFPVREAVKEFLELARQAGVRRVVVLSSLTVIDRRGGDYIGEHHRGVEAAVEVAGLEWTHVRPSEFAGTALQKWGHSIRSEGVARAPYADSVRVPIHEADIASVIVTALLEDGHAGRAYVVTGPEALTHVDQVRVIGEVIGREIRFEELTHEQGWEQLSRYVPGHLVDGVLTYMANSVDKPMTVLPTVEEVTGNPARSFTQWVADHAQGFRSRN